VSVGVIALHGLPGTVDPVFGLLVFLVGLMASIAVHELGHLLVAKWSGGRVSEFMVGFGPRLASFRVGATRYGLKLLPFGGYVRILGMHAPGKGPDRPETEEERLVPGRDFYELSVPRRTATLLAGVFANLVFAAVLLLVVLVGIGVPRATASLQQVSVCAETVCTPSSPLSPAATAGLQPGDRIVSLGGVMVADWDELSGLIRSLEPGSVVDVDVLTADGVARSVTVTLAANPSAPDSAFLGVTPAVELVRDSPGRVPSLLADQVVSVTSVLTEFPARVGEAFSSSLSGEERDPSGAVGIVGAGRIGAELGGGDLPLSVRLGQLLALLAGLNVSLAVFNLIPLLPLDGGHVAVVWFEGLRRRLARLRKRPDPGPVDMRRLMPVTYSVIALLITSSLLLLWADLVNPISLP
jgi:membrane-associated protease RseP (regulator of RpoE activity)